MRSFRFLMKYILINFEPYSYDNIVVIAILISVGSNWWYLFVVASPLSAGEQSARLSGFIESDSK